MSESNPAPTLTGLPPGVAEAFRIGDPPVRLPGGQGATWRAGAIILKPGHDPIAAAWEAETFLSIEQDGFRVARPIQASSGEWCVEGWCAWNHLEGEPTKLRWTDRLEVIKRFHDALAGVPEPSHLKLKTDPWALAGRVAWGEKQAMFSGPFRKPLVDLFAMLRPVSLPSQVIHGDFAWENVLFHSHLPPAVIDFSPCWRPAGWAIAIAVNDALAWEGADVSILSTVDRIPQFFQLLARATIMRLGVAEGNYRAGRDPECSDLTCHMPVVGICLARAGSAG